MKQKNKPRYPAVELAPGALDGLPSGVAAQLRCGRPVYQYGPPNKAGLVLVGTDPGMGGSVAAFVHASCIVGGPAPMGGSY